MEEHPMLATEVFSMQPTQMLFLNFLAIPLLCPQACLFHPVIRVSNHISQ
jgi:hypothetical protein